MAYGFFCVGLVLGWAALFAGGASWRARFTQLGWIAALLLFGALSPEPRDAVLGITAGLGAHLCWQSRLWEIRA